MIKAVHFLGASILGGSFNRLDFADSLEQAISAFDWNGGIGRTSLDEVWAISRQQGSTSFGFYDTETGAHDLVGCDISDETRRRWQKILDGKPPALPILP